MRLIIGEISKTVSTIGKEEGYTLILERMQGGIIYIPDDLDLTEKVIERFNQASKEDKKD
jgi:outer membrane protein